METLKKISDGQYQLCRNDQPLPCPYAARLLVPGSVQGTAGISAVVCGSLCPLFRISGSAIQDRMTVVLCNGTCYPDLSITDQKADKNPGFLRSL